MCNDTGKRLEKDHSAHGVNTNYLRPVVQVVAHCHFLSLVKLISVLYNFGKSMIQNNFVNLEFIRILRSAYRQSDFAQ